MLRLGLDRLNGFVLFRVGGVRDSLGHLLLLSIFLPSVSVGCHSAMPVATDAGR